MLIELISEGYRRHGALNYDKERRILKRDESNESIHGGDHRDGKKRQHSQDSVLSDQRHGSCKKDGGDPPSDAENRRREYKRDGSNDSIQSSSSKAPPMMYRRDGSVDSITTATANRRRRDYGRDDSAESVESERFISERPNPDRVCSEHGGPDHGSRNVCGKTKDYVVRGVWTSDAVDSNRLARQPGPSSQSTIVAEVQERAFDSIDSENYGANRLPQYRAGYTFGSERLAAMTRQIRNVRATPETRV